MTILLECIIQLVVLILKFVSQDAPLYRVHIAIFMHSNNKCT